jgi:arabinogalactan oligomer/maltooligosaccharide transport system permease protein
VVQTIDRIDMIGSPESPHKPGGGRRSGSLAALVVKILALGTVIGVAFALLPTLLAQERWGYLTAFVLIAVAIVATYATQRGLPLKYLLPGTLLLLTLVVYPAVSTAQVSFTNFGDGTRTTQEQAVAQIIGSSIVQTPDAPRYNLTVGTTGSKTEGPFAFLLVDPDGDTAYAGTEDGLEEIEATIEGGFVTEADGYELLTPKEVNAASEALRDFTVPTDDGAIRQLGIRQAFEGSSPLEYDEDAATITNTTTGVVYSTQQQGDREYFVAPDGSRLSDQSWRANVGFANYERALTDSRISGDFLRIFVWTVIFATLTVVLTFTVGLLLAVTMNDPRVRGQRLYRSILILPYAVPGFIMILIWSSFWNRDFGLINDLTGLDVNWLGNATAAKVAILVTNVWLGFPYMFIVATGALQAIPADLKEAATMDGASGFLSLRKITFPLVLVTTAPLLVATFAFNFNNYNIIYLLTEGGPFTPENPQAGGTDILISYTIRLAFGPNGAQFGFASSIAILLFLLTGVLAAIQFRFTRALEDVH